MSSLSFDIAHLLAGCMVLVSFVLLYQRRMFGVLNTFAVHAFVLAWAAAWQAYVQGAPHLYITAAIALLFKALFIPMALHRIVQRLSIHRAVETVFGVGVTMLGGVGLVALSIALILPVTAASAALAREDLVFALSVVLLGLLMMITRRNAIAQVVGFMSLENGLILAAVGVKGMPLVVEISVAFSVLIAFIVFGVFLFRIRERFDTLDVHRARPVPGRDAVSLMPEYVVAAILVVPLVAAAILAVLPGYRLGARVNVTASFLTFLAVARAVRGATGSPVCSSWSTTSTSI